MLTVYYASVSDYQNKNRFNDQIEGNNNAIYNAFLSPTSVDFYYKVNNKLQTLNLQMADFIPLSVTGMRLTPNSFSVNSVDGNGAVIKYGSVKQQPTVTITSNIANGGPNEASTSLGGSVGY